MPDDLKQPALGIAATIAVEITKSQLQTR